MLKMSMLLMFNVIISELYIKINDFFLNENKRLVYEQQLDIISASTSAQKKMLEEFYEEKHNLINEMIAIKLSIEKKDNEIALKNINRIIKNSHISDAIANTGNLTVDSLINFKYAIAKEFGIEFHLKIFIPPELSIEQCDIGVVLGNALDNAIEATKNCAFKEKIIEIVMGIKKEAWVIVIKNPYEFKLKVDRDGNFMSTKKEYKRHGYGLNSIKKIVESYQGEVITETENNIFSITVLMNLKDF